MQYTWNTWLMLALLLWNTIVLCLYGLDKRRAIRGAWRIPEHTLLLSAFLGGGVGACLGMLLFRHKTRHLKFQILVPLAAVLTLMLAYFLLGQL